MFCKSVKCTKDVYFYKILVSDQVFFKSKFTYAIVNIKPLAPGHVLVVPLRTSVLRFGDLTCEESMDYMKSLQIIQKFIIHNYKADALNIAIQDGPESGQSIPHLHTHLVPRYKSDSLQPKFYENLESLDLEKSYNDFFERKKSIRSSSNFLKSFHDEDDRDARSSEEMIKEALTLKEKLNEFIKENDIKVSFEC